MDQAQRERFEQAVDRKREEAERRSHEGAQHARGSAVGSAGGEQELTAHGRTQDVGDPRAKNSGHGKKTADKWNQ